MGIRTLLLVLFTCVMQHTAVLLGNSSTLNKRGENPPRFRRTTPAALSLANPLPSAQTLFSFSAVMAFHEALNKNGVLYFCSLAKEFVLITSNANHPAFDVDESNLHIIRQNGPSLKEALAELKSEYGCERITIQSGGTLNSLFLHEKLFDYIDIVIAPVLIGGKDTPTLIDGKSLLSESKLSKIGVLKLQECMVLKKSYLRLRYKVIH